MTGARKKSLGRPPDADSERAHRALLDSARRHFAARGFGTASVRDIADDAGFAASAVYHYFTSKTELYVSVFRDAERTVSDAYERAIDGLDSRAARVQALFDATIALHAADESVSRFLAACALEVSRHPELAPPVGALRMRTNEILSFAFSEADAPAERALVRAFGGMTIGIALIAPVGRHDVYAAMIEAARRCFVLP